MKYYEEHIHDWWCHEFEEARYRRHEDPPEVEEEPIRGMTKIDMPNGRVVYADLDFLSNRHTSWCNFCERWCVHEPRRGRGGSWECLGCGHVR
jgi:hypothetical protein